MPAALTHPAGTEPDCKSKSNSSITFRVTRNLPANGFGFKQKLEAQTSTTVPRSHVQKGSYASLPREDMPFAHHYSLQNKKLYHHAVVQSVQDKLLLRKKPTCTMASATVLCSTERLRICHCFKSHFLHPSRSVRLCQPLPPVLLSPLWPLPLQPSVVKKWLLPASHGVYSLRGGTIRHGWLQC